jgi:hypothetical protein
MVGVEDPELVEGVDSRWYGASDGWLRFRCPANSERWGNPKLGFRD